MGNKPVITSVFSVIYRLYIHPFQPGPAHVDKSYVAVFVASFITQQLSTQHCWNTRRWWWCWNSAEDSTLHTWESLRCMAHLGSQGFQKVQKQILISYRRPVGDIGCPGQGHITHKHGRRSIESWPNWTSGWLWKGLNEHQMNSFPIKLTYSKNQVVPFCSSDMPNQGVACTCFYCKNILSSRTHLPVQLLHISPLALPPVSCHHLTIFAGPDVRRALWKCASRAQE